ncbi:MAG: acyl-CoA thioesterase [Candidatus Omnitrophota bacterium]
MSNDTSQPLFEYHTTIKLHEVDGAGILFFANYFKLAHDTLEGFLESRGMEIGGLIAHAPYILPVAHSEMDYKMSLKTGDKVTVQLRVEKIGDSSVTLGYRFLRMGTEPAAEGRIIHVAIDRKNGKKIPLPQELMDILNI